MKKKDILIFICSFIFLNNITASDTLRIMQYNVMRFGLNDVGCDQNNNDIINKTTNIGTIIKYIEPDILTINEICDTSFYHTFFLYSVFNLNGFNHYNSGPVNGNYLTSQIFYNTEKIVLKKTEVIPTNINQNTRESYVYTFYYRSKELINKDTVFFKIILVHLRAGETYENERGQQAQIIMNYLAGNEVINYFVIGDMNLYSSTETAYQKFTNYSENTLSLIDPGIAGQWHDNMNYSLYHTQSTHSEISSCFSSGGLDDRFDFVLFSKSIQNNFDKINYIQNSFKILGQDGNHQNQAVNNGTNISAPTNIINSLFQNSDHLPVYLDIKIEQTPINIPTINSGNIYININDERIFTQVPLQSIHSNLNISIFNLKGQCLVKDSEICNNSSITINAKNEIIIILIKTENQIISIKQFIK